MTAPGTLYLIATPIGNLEDITLRALRTLAGVDLLYAEDTRAAAVLLDRHQIDRSGGVRSCFEGNEAERAAEILAALQSGQSVGYISEAGTPGVSDPGQRLAAQAIAGGAHVVALPGASAVLTALVGSGLPTERYYFVGFPPREAGPRQQLYGSLRMIPATLVIYEAPHRAAESLTDLCLALGEERPACVARELTKVYEEYRRGTLGALRDHYVAEAARGELCLIVGGAVEGLVAPSEEELEVEIRRRLALGESTKQLAAALSLKTGLPRRQLYQLALQLQQAIERDRDS